MGENVKIPLTLFNQTIDLLECFDTNMLNGFDPILAMYHTQVLSAFQDKRQNLELRKSYAKVIFAKDEDERTEARINYLHAKNMRE